MANFFRGLASGLESGYKLGDTLQKYRERQAYEEAMKAQPEYTPPAGATPEQLALAQVETAKLQQQDIRDFGLSPEEAKSYAPASPGRYSFLGKEYTSPLSEAQIGLARREQMANVAAQYGNPLEAERLRASIRAEQSDTERLGMERERLGLTKKTTEQQLTQGELAIEEAKRKAADEALMRNLNQSVTEFQKTNNRAPNITELRSLATSLGATTDQLFKVGSTLTGIAETDARALKLEIEKKIRGAGLDKLIDLHKNDPTFDDNSYFEKIVGKDGRIVLNMKDKEGRPIGSQTFSSANEATAYLAQQAVDPANVYTWLQASRKAESDIAKNQSVVAENQSIVGLRQAQASALRDAKPTPAEQERLNEIQSRFANAKTLTEKASIQDEYNMFISEMATSRGKPTPVRPPQERELSEREKIAYDKYLEAIKDLPLNAPQAQIDALAARYGVTNIVGGGQGLPSWNTSTPAPAAAPSAPTPGRATGRGQGLGGPLRESQQAAPNPRSLVLTKLPKKLPDTDGLPDTAEWVYVDPKTKKQYTEAEYQQLLR